ncbi:MAG: tRNA adenosine(34) deaminase TadA [Desulfobacteraceae bacterium]|nr:tRNA adenosine(34) deaminase TadA [Desulfobacteraceae bacterium]
MIEIVKPIKYPAMDHSHEYFMQMAIDQAGEAARMNEVPVGAVIVNADNQVIARDHNRTISRCDPSAHAEMNVLRTAALKIGNYRLLSSKLYVTIEPCVMCMGAMVHARVKTVVFGALDPKWGAAKSLYQLGQDPRLNHQVEIIEGICENRCRSLIQTFFRNRRKAI